MSRTARTEPARHRQQGKGCTLRCSDVDCLVGLHHLHDHIAVLRRRLRNIHGTRRPDTEETTIAIAIGTIETIAEKIHAIEETIETETVTVPIPVAIAAITMRGIGTETETEDILVTVTGIKMTVIPTRSLTVVGPIARMTMRMREPVNVGGSMMSESEKGLLTIGIRGAMTDRENRRGWLLTHRELIVGILHPS